MSRSLGPHNQNYCRPQATLIEDPALQAQLQPWVEMECIQLSNGKKVAQMDCLRLGNQKIVRERQWASVQKLGRTPAGFCTLSISTQEPTTRFSEHCCAHDNTVFFLPENVDYDVHVPAGGETAYIGFSQEDFLNGARVLNPAFWDKPPKTVMPLITRRQCDLKDAIDLWLESARQVIARGETLDQKVLQGHLLHTALQIVTVTEDGIAPAYNERLRALQISRKARAYVDDQLNADILPTIVDICEALGVSERTLRYAFQEYVGLSPVAYLRACRLNKVRAVLAACDPLETSITQVAMRFGFMHLSRFSGDYRRMFGVTPSETLSR